MNANTYNKVRRIVFCTANNPKKGFSVAYEWMEKTYRKKLGAKGYVGLMAELKFYEKHKNEFMLTVAGDMGEHADFSGQYKDKPSRFDITTNLAYKSLQDYEPFLADGPIYQIALVDPSNFEVSDIVSLSFQRCECGGYLVPFILLKDQNYNRHGESTWSNDQLEMIICTDCQDFSELCRHTHHFLFSPLEHYNMLPDDISEEEIKASLTDHSLNAYKYFRREFNDELMAVAGHEYKTTGPKGEGFWTFNFSFKNQVIAYKIPDDVDCGLL